MSTLRKIDNLIRVILEQEFFTKEETPIEFSIHEQSPDVIDNLGRGWVVHRIDAFVDGEQAGYIKISYIPNENFKKEYPSIVHFVDKVGGSTFYPGKEYSRLIKTYDYKSDAFYDVPLEMQVLGLDHMTGYPFLFDKGKKSIDDYSEEELVKLKEELLNELWEKRGREFKEFENFHVDKPLVDYIKVFPDFKRKRIGAALYEKAGRWLANKGLKLYASGIQSDEAKATWEWLKKNKGANIGTEKHGKRIRTYLSYL